MAKKPRHGSQPARPSRDRRESETTRPSRNRRDEPVVKRRDDPVAKRRDEPIAKRRDEPVAKRREESFVKRRDEPVIKRRDNRPQRPQESQPRTASGEVWIYGLHAVTAALRNPARKVLRIVGTTEALATLRGDQEIDVPALAHAHPTGRNEIDTLVGSNAVHQGVAVLTRALEPDLGDVLDALGDRKSVCLMVLDQVTDPHNVGAVLRSAAAFGAAAVIAPERGAPEETGAMAKAASGALDITPYIKGGNLVRVLEQLKEHGFWLVGLAADAPRELAAVDLTGRIALLVGAEGEGLRRLVRETCDHLARLPMRGAMESLNASNAAAVALYEWTRQTTANT